MYNRNKSSVGRYSLNKPPYYIGGSGNTLCFCSEKEQNGRLHSTPAQCIIPLKWGKN